LVYFYKYIPYRFSNNLLISLPSHEFVYRCEQRTAKLNDTRDSLRALAYHTVTTNGNGLPLSRKFY